MKPEMKPKMKLKIYTEEIFQRGRLWYLIFGLLLLLIIGISFIKDNIYGGVIIIIFMLIYLFFHIKPSQPEEIQITPEGFHISNTIISRINFQAYCIEIDKKTLQIKNIVLIKLNNTHNIYTIADNLENIQKFTKKLEEYLPRTGEYKQTSLEKLYRKIKL